MWLYAHVIPYGGKVWRAECLANLLFSNVWRKKVWRMNRSAIGLSMVTINLDGFSLANRRRFAKFAKLSPRQTFPLYGNCVMGIWYGRKCLQFSRFGGHLQIFKQISFLHWMSRLKFLSFTNIFCFLFSTRKFFCANFPLYDILDIIQRFSQKIAIELLARLSLPPKLLSFQPYERFFGMLMCCSTSL